MRSLPLVFLIACGSSSTDDAGDHVLHDRSVETPEELHIRYTGTQVAVATELTELADRIGLPLRGTADVAYDVSIPKVDGILDLAHATGSIAMTCTKCQIGDDKAKLSLAPANARARTFAGDGIDFGHVTVDKFEAKVVVADGTARLTSWTFVSPDVELDVDLAIRFGKRPGESMVDGCLQFRPTKELERRDPKLFSLLAMTGATLADDGRYHIKLAGSMDKPRRLAQPCKG